MGQLYYVYGFMPDTAERKLPDLTGMDGISLVEYPKIRGIRVACCLVPEEEFGEKAFRENKENMEWVKNNAFHHHQVMHELQQSKMVIPLPFGTVYETLETVEKVTAEHKEELIRLFRELAGTEEWSIKLYADRSVFDDAFIKNEKEVRKRKKEIEKMSRGRQYFAKKKLPEELQRRAQEKIRELCASLHNDLLVYTDKTKEKKIWKNNISGRREEMVWNGVYLFTDHAAAEKAMKVIDEFQKDAEIKYPGMIVEAAGPWPPYHFAGFQLSESGKEGGGRYASGTSEE